MDDEEKRFPRISLWQFLSGIWHLIVRVSIRPLDYNRPSREQKNERR
jgi:hypothetical protein